MAAFVVPRTVHDAPAQTVYRLWRTNSDGSRYRINDYETAAEADRQLVIAGRYFPQPGTRVGQFADTVIAGYTIERIDPPTPDVFVCADCGETNPQYRRDCPQCGEMLCADCSYAVCGNCDRANHPAEDAADRNLADLTRFGVHLATEGLSFAARAALCDYTPGMAIVTPDTTNASATPRYALYHQGQLVCAYLDADIAAAMLADYRTGGDRIYRCDAYFGVYPVSHGCPCQRHDSGADFKATHPDYRDPVADTPEATADRYVAALDSPDHAERAALRADLAALEPDNAPHGWAEMHLIAAQARRDASATIADPIVRNPLFCPDCFADSGRPHAPACPQITAPQDDPLATLTRQRADDRAILIKLAAHLEATADRYCYHDTARIMEATAAALRLVADTAPHYPPTEERRAAGLALIASL